MRRRVAVFGRCVAFLGRCVAILRRCVAKFRQCVAFVRRCVAKICRCVANFRRCVRHFRRCMLTSIEVTHTMIKTTHTMVEVTQSMVEYTHTSVKEADAATGGSASEPEEDNPSMFRCSTRRKDGETVGACGGRVVGIRGAGVLGGRQAGVRAALSSAQGEDFVRYLGLRAGVRAGGSPGVCSARGHPQREKREEQCAIMYEKTLLRSLSVGAQRRFSLVLPAYPRWDSTPHVLKGNGF